MIQGQARFCKIVHGTHIFRAAVCEHCGCRMWPAKDLTLHLLIHEVKEDRHKKTKAENRRMFTSLRGNW